MTAAADNGGVGRAEYCDRDNHAQRGDSGERSGRGSSDRVTAAVRDAVGRYGLRGARLLVGYSGGGDSSALLHALLSCQGDCGITPVALHLNHCMRGDEAERDERHCRRFCAAHGVTLRICRADVPAYAREHGMGLEEAARELRYACLREAAAEYGCECIVTAHHANDELETMLFRLARGSALAGLCGIPEYSVSALSGGIPVLRPLLSLPRAEIDSYVAENGIEFVTDSTNLEPCCARNVIRSRCVPALCELSPHAPEAANRTARLLREDEALLSALAALPDEGLRRLTALLGEYRDTAASDSSAQASTAVDTRNSLTPCSVGHCSTHIDKKETVNRFGTSDSTRIDIKDTVIHTTVDKAFDTMQLISELPEPLLRRRLLSFFSGYRARHGISAELGSGNLAALSWLCRSGETSKTLSLPGGIRATKLPGGIMLSPDSERESRARTERPQNSRRNCSGSGCGKNDGGDCRDSSGGKDSKDSKDCRTLGEIPLYYGENRLPDGSLLIIDMSGVTRASIETTDFSDPDKTDRASSDGATVAGCTAGFITGFTEGGAANLSAGSTADGVSADTAKFRDAQGENIYNLSTNITVSSAKLKGTLSARMRQPGDRVFVRGMHRSLKNLFREAGIPPELRRQLPIVCDGDGIVWIPFVAVRDGVLHDAADGSPCVDLSFDAACRTPRA